MSSVVEEGEELEFDEQRFVALLFDAKSKARQTFKRLMSLDEEKALKVRDAVIVVNGKLGSKRRRYISLRELTSQNANAAGSGAAQGAAVGALYGLLAPIFLPLTVAAGAATGAALGEAQSDHKSELEHGDVVQDVVERHLKGSGNAVLLLWISHIKDRVRVGGVVGGCGGRVVDSNLSASRRQLIERLLAGDDPDAVSELEQLAEARKREAAKQFRTDRRSDDPNSWARQLGWIKSDGVPTSTPDRAIVLHPKYDDDSETEDAE